MGITREQLINVAGEINEKKADLKSLLTLVIPQVESDLRAFLRENPDKTGKIIELGELRISHIESLSLTFYPKQGTGYMYPPSFWYNEFNNIGEKYGVHVSINNCYIPN